MEFQKQMIKEDEEFLRQLDFEINQLMISSWPNAQPPANNKILMNTLSTSTVDEIFRGRNASKSLRPAREVLIQQHHQHDSKDSVFNKGGSSEDAWVGETAEKIKTQGNLEIFNENS